MLLFLAGIKYKLLLESLNVGISYTIPKYLNASSIAFFLNSISPHLSSPISKSKWSPGFSLDNMAIASAVESCQSKLPYQSLFMEILGMIKT